MLQRILIFIEVNINLSHILNGTNCEKDYVLAS